MDVIEDYQNVSMDLDEMKTSDDNKDDVSPLNQPLKNSVQPVEDSSVGDESMHKQQLATENHRGTHPSEELDNSDEGDDDDDDDDGNDSSDSSSTDEAEEALPQTHAVAEEGRMLSEYERQRLERIERNRQYLEQLGLQGNEKGSGLLGGHKPSVARRKKSEPSDTQVSARRSSITRQSKLRKVSYVEPSVRDLLRVVDGQTEAGDKKKMISVESVSAVKTQLLSKKDPIHILNQEPKKTTKEPLDNFIFLEFKHIQSRKRLAVKAASRNVRLAEKEVKYWTRLMEVWERKNERRMELELQRQAEAEEKAIFGGKSTKELLKMIDARMPSMVQAIKRYDEYILTTQREQEKELKRCETDRRLKTLNALDRFPKAMQEAVSLLNGILLGSAPSEPPPPRRSRRSTGDEDQNDPPRAKPKSINRAHVVPDLDDVHTKLELSGLKRESSVENECETLERSSNGKQRYRARNVGGWISPEFAKEIDRSWLTRDTPPDTFELSQYVPQVGDIVLYYMSGHRVFLEEYPDILGKKTKSKLRIPLWERPDRQKDGEPSANEVTASTWWTAEWLAGMKSSNLGDYPLICCVERTHAEFPPDPFCKVVQRDANNETKVYFRKSKNFPTEKSSRATHMRLAVTLRPLTPLYIPTLNNNRINGDDMKLAKPPLFTAVTFPCQLEPFLVPFAWGYARSHSVSVNQKVTVGARNDVSVRVDAFASLDSGSNMRLDDNLSSIRRLLSYFDTAPSKYSALEKALADENLELPTREASVVLDTWYRAVKPLAGSCLRDSDSLGFVAVLANTLPLWKSVTIMHSMYDRKRQRVSPWLLSPVGKRPRFSSPWDLELRSARLEKGLLLKLEYLLEDVAAESSSAMETFYHPVTDTEAPGYFCAVPVGLALSNIVQRLQVTDNTSGSYYRSVEAILADVSAILDCCLLYNSPQSEVVDDAVALVSTLKSQVLQLVKEHCREVSHSQKLDISNRCLLQNHHIHRSSVIVNLTKPFKDRLNREWLESCNARSMKRSETSGSNIPSGLLLLDSLQAGDVVLYSRRRHIQFVEGHESSLEAEHCCVPPEVLGAGSHDNSDATGNDGSFNDDWVEGEIVWTHATFPKALSKQSATAVSTFPTLAAMQCLAIKYQESDDVSVLFWRPCSFDFDGLSTGIVCSACGLSQPTSFLRYSSSTSHTVPTEVDQTYHSTQWLPSIDGCLSLMKRRCLRGEYPAFVDPLLTKENIASGYKPAATRIAKGTIPSFERLLSPSPSNLPGLKNHTTRGVLTKPQAEDTGVQRLVDSGFLPIWISASDGGIINDNLLRKVEGILPCTKASLEHVQLRIQAGYYRQRAAIINDIVEAYLAIVVAVLSPAVSRRKSPLSMKRIAQTMAAVPHDSGTFPPIAEQDPVAEENALVQRLLGIRALYAGALVAASDTVHTELVFGLSRCVPKSSVVQGPANQDPSCVLARQKLTYLIGAFGKDEQLNSFRAIGNDCVPITKFVVKYGGKLASFEHDVVPLLATIRGDTVKVSIRLESRPAFFGQPSACLVRDLPGNAPRRKSIAPAVYFVHEDYMRNDFLSKILFSRPGRNNACARCQALKRTMLTCRVLRRHVNIDFDWVAAFSGGIGNVDDLLKTLDPSFALQTEALFPGENEALSEVAGYEHPRIEDQSRHDADSVDENQLDPREFFDRATSALSVSKEILDKATIYFQTPSRLSKEFIQSSYPIDPEDGHYLYCVICGFGGDLLCCDSCPNVVHCKCIDLSRLPDGDWFCEECTISRRTNNEESSKLSPSRVHRTKPDENEPKSFTLSFDTPKSNLPFGRNEFDEGESELVASLLKELRSSRPSQKAKAGVKDDADGESVSSADVDSLQIDSSRRKGGRSTIDPPSRASDMKLPRILHVRSAALQDKDGQLKQLPGSDSNDTNKEKGSKKRRMPEPDSSDSIRVTRRKVRHDSSPIQTIGNCESTQQTIRDSNHERDPGMKYPNGRKTLLARKTVHGNFTRNKMRVAVEENPPTKDRPSSAVLSVCTVDSAPHQVRASSRIRCPPVRFVDTIKETTKH